MIRLKSKNAECVSYFSKKGTGAQSAYGLVLQSTLTHKLEQRIRGQLPPAIFALPLAYATVRHLLQLVGMPCSNYNTCTNFYSFGSDPVCLVGKHRGIFLKSPDNIMDTFGKLHPSGRV